MANYVCIYQRYYAIGRTYVEENIKLYGNRKVARIHHVNVGVLLKEMVMDCKWLSRVCYIISYQL